MLKRRNTIHPVQQPAQVQRQPAPFVSKFIATNPFLSSSFDDLKNNPAYSAEELQKDGYAIKHRHARTSSDAMTTSNATNPFLYEPTTYITNPMVDACRPDQWENYANEDSYDEYSANKRGSQKYKTHSRPGGSRRLSLDVFRAQFGWHRRRRATCTSPDLKRMPIFNQSHDRTEEIISSFTNLNQPLEGAVRGTNDEMILKSSRYYPGEDGAKSNQQHNEEQTFTESRQRSLNPFLNSDSNLELTSFAEAHPEESSERYTTGQQHQPQSSTAHENNANLLERRRHSVFSDWSIEDCPRLLAFQKKQQELQEQQEKQEKQEQKSRQQQVFSASRMSLTKSMTDTILDQYQDLDNIRQHRRHTSACHRSQNAPSPAPSSLKNPRRNSVVIGRNIIRQRPTIRSLYETPSSRHYLEVESRSVYQYDATHAYEDNDASDHNYEAPQNEPYETSQNLWSSGPVHPFNQPAWQLRSLGRYESQSYAQDFMKNGELWVPRPWTTTASNSSCGSSPSSPLYHSTFPHEREDYQDSQDDLGQTVPSYQDIGEVQRQPYEQEGRVEEDYGQNYDEYSGNEHNSVYDFGAHLDHGHSDRPYHEDENDIRFFYNSVDWQKTDEIEEQDNRLRSSAASSNQSSRDRLTRRATLAKKKFYKLLKQPQQIQSDTDLTKEEDEEVELDDDPSRSANSVYSVTSSLRAKMRLAPKTKTVLRQVKRRISTAARTVMSEASKAASNVTPILRSNTKGKNNNNTRSQPSSASHYDYEYSNDSYYGPPESVGSSGIDHQEYYQHYHSGYNNESHSRHASVASR
ncbi:hypothetical protein BGX27_003212 [Mortierella sp. AM989]|nr:hypothetical protein BGX27_003212 [Mortierella sp. AM989]